ncbi:MAG: tetratricopeptide repeat protein [Sphingopyxis sp.]|uniref:tetratricopeptide repeat protein n=1 Tax=Sphingopyxis sp. TaxID=1908224 RepID=UPI002ABB8C82|nr:tetratricopeptide repeat protein [Sphingopyxis sp.]MDZ3833453.1 tetratricopeptide repeat protein [Sphingopyxis sp.]
MDDAKANEKLENGEVERIIAKELDQLLASPMFVRSPVLSRLLQFLVEHRLQGGRAAPKAYAIATEALGRSADFDPAVDSYPRVMVGRLRSLLDRYYGDTAWVHRLRVPQGSYEVVVQYRTPPPARSTAPPVDDAGQAAAEVAPPATLMGNPAREASWPVRRLLFWVVAIALVGAALFVSWRQMAGPGGLFATAPQPLPVVEVSPPAAGESPISRALARALDGKLRDGLRRFDLIDLMSARAGDATVPAARADYRIDVSLVRTTDGPADVTIMLNRLADQRTIWSQQLRLTEEQLPEFDGLEPVIAQVAGDYGVIVRDQVQRQPDNFASGYPCLAQFHRMRQMRDSRSARRVEACLRDTVEAQPLDTVALSALSWVRFGQWQAQRDTPEGKAIFAEARDLAQRAYRSGPGVPIGLFAVARSHFYSGNCAAGNAMGEAAVRLNSYDPDMAGFLGLYKVVCGDEEAGEKLLRQSLYLDSAYPGVPAVTLAFLMSQRGEQEQALAILNEMPSPSNVEPQYMMVRAIVVARQGHLAEGRRLWERVLDHTGQPANASPEAVLRHFMITPAVIDRSVEALRESGVVAGKGSA